MGDVMRSGLSDAWSLVATSVPKLLAFLLILLVGWLVARAVAKAVDLLLTRTGFPRLIERSGLGAVLTRSKVDIAGLVVRLAFWFVLLIALQLALGVFGPGNAASLLLAGIVAYLPRIVVAIVLVVVAAAIARVVRDLAVALLGDRGFGHPVRITATVAPGEGEVSGDRSAVALANACGDAPESASSSPPPTRTKVRRRRRSASSSEASARSKAERTRLRMAVASSIFFRPGANGSHSSLPK